ncbi:dual specificity protein phosphatase 3-like [Tubulanus polymorphus]|uniref:dual specificity protein phosphatase 3-like n=1 Tax=Tubulanus polymorphus TaxID=672921 RepID=UPI003DA3D4CD
MASSINDDEGSEPSCTIDEVHDILTADTGGLVLLPSNAYDEVYKDVYIGEESIARNHGELKCIGITHIMNAALGRGPYCVRTGPSLYKNLGIEFIGFEAIDATAFDLSQYFYEAADFIENALRENGKLLVHCREGVSRSATLVIAFLMIKRRVQIRDAVRLVRRGREIYPNDGFVEQLCKLNDQLRKNGHFG